MKRVGERPAAEAIKENDKNADQELTVIKEAWINASTKLPYKLIDGGSTWTYSFSADNASLSLPPSCNQALQNYMQAIESAKYRRLP